MLQAVQKSDGSGYAKEYNFLGNRGAAISTRISTVERGKGYATYRGRES